MRYNVAMIAELSKLRLLPFRLSFDGGEPLVTELTMAAIGNTKSYGGGMLICPGADPTDGLLDVTMVISASRTRLVRLFPTVFKGTHVDLDTVTHAARRDGRGGVPGYQRVRRRRIRLSAAREESARCRGALRVLTPA